jgi:hypothetical protein
MNQHEDRPGSHSRSSRFVAQRGPELLDFRSNDNAGLLSGWDYIPTHRASVLLPQVASLARSDKFQFPGLGTWRYVTDTPYRHIYEFYRKPA